MTYTLKNIYEIHAFLRYVNGKEKQKYSLIYHYGLGGWKCELRNRDYSIETKEYIIEYSPKYFFV